MDTEADVRAFAMTIPAGCLATYGEIGLAAGIGPRQAGRAVSRLDDDVPWWRIVYADGTPATCHEGAARTLLETEGVPFFNDHVDMKKLRRSDTP